MRIGVVSDTHNHLPNVSRIVELFNAADVERVVHTGDITQAKTLEVLSGLEASLHGVYGNNDLERDSLEAAATRHDFRICDPPLELSWAEREIWVCHDPREFETRLGETQSDGAEPALILHGHDHRYRLERRGGSLIFNPGECAGHLHGRNAVGVVDLTRLECEIVRF
jgi:putative phosphoesterase